MSDFLLKIQEHITVIEDLRDSLPEVGLVAQKMIDAIRAGGKIIWMGNGGSAADAQHLAAELVGRFQLERPAIPSIALTTDTSVLTSVGNDYSFADIFSRQLEALCGKSDVVVGISTSGNSENVIRGIEVARLKGAFTVGMLGKDGGRLRDLVDLALVVPSDVTARVQEGHGLLGHILCESVEEEFCMQQQG
ncbi:MAG: D-sedoheptulose 7-phosphate isomerase [Gammaproteobacteria bacterium]|nr:D-sedoheptulose 7-phosphate isomerase [Gammaproteobacteria bacterium]